MIFNIVQFCAVTSAVCQEVLASEIARMRYLVIGRRANRKKVPVDPERITLDIFSI